MILILAGATDPIAAGLAACLQAGGTDVCTLDEQLMSGMPIAWEIDEGGAITGEIRTPDRTVCLRDVAGVFARPAALLRPRSSLDLDEDLLYIYSEQHAVLEGLLEALPGRVVDRPWPGHFGRGVWMHRAYLDHARAAGFQIPRCRAVTHPDDARSFLRECGGAVAGRSFYGSAASETFDGPDAELRLTEALSRHPLLLTEQPGGAATDVFVAGQTCIVAPAVEGGADREALPNQVLAACRRLAEACGSLAARLALVTCPSGAPFCTEIQRADRLTPPPMALLDSFCEALADVLIGARR